MALDTSQIVAAGSVLTYTADVTFNSSAQPAAILQQVQAALAQDGVSVISAVPTTDNIFSDAADFYMGNSSTFSLVMQVQDNNSYDSIADVQQQCDIEIANATGFSPSSSVTSYSPVGGATVTGNPSSVVSSNPLSSLGLGSVGNELSNAISSFSQNTIIALVVVAVVVVLVIAWKPETVGRVAHSLA